MKMVRLKNKPLAIMVIALLLTGCNSNSNTDLKRPSDTNLEFWITERANTEDFEAKGCTFLPGWFGAQEFLDSRYEAIEEDGRLVAPETHVTYLLTGYPDLIDEPAVTHIEITDPYIEVYGLTTSSTEQEIISRLSKMANSFSFVTTVEECYIRLQIENCTFSFMSDMIVIDVPVTNNQGIVF